MYITVTGMVIVWILICRWSIVQRDWHMAMVMQTQEAALNNKEGYGLVAGSLSPWRYCQVIMVCIYFLLVSSILRTVLCIESILKHFKASIPPLLNRIHWICFWLQSLKMMRQPGFSPKFRATSESIVRTPLEYTFRRIVSYDWVAQAKLWVS